MNRHVTLNPVALPLAVLGGLLGLGVITLNTSRVITGIAALAIIAVSDAVRVTFMWDGVSAGTLKAFAFFTTCSAVIVVLAIANALVNIFS